MCPRLNTLNPCDQRTYSQEVRRHLQVAAVYLVVLLQEIIKNTNSVLWDVVWESLLLLNLTLMKFGKAFVLFVISSHIKLVSQVGICVAAV